MKLVNSMSKMKIVSLMVAVAALGLTACEQTGGQQVPAEPQPEPQTYNGGRRAEVYRTPGECDYLLFTNTAGGVEAAGVRTIPGTNGVCFRSAN